MPYWPDVTLPVGDALISMNSLLDVAFGFNGSALIYLPDDIVSSTLLDMSPGFGYWIKSSQMSYLIYPDWEGPFFYEGDGTPKNEIHTDVQATRNWISVYGSGITIDGHGIVDGSKIEFINEDGIVSGRGLYSDGFLKFTPVYGSDEIPKATNIELSESCTITIDGQRVYPDLRWTEHGARVEIGELFSLSTGSLPEDYNLSQNYPNPFNPVTNIEFALQKSNRVILEVFNITGQKVKVLLDDYHEAGSYTIQWDGTDNNDNRVASGMYLYRLTSGDYTESKKMILVK